MDGSARLLELTRKCCKVVGVNKKLLLGCWS
jgi:hypothetical protein